MTRWIVAAIAACTFALGTVAPAFACSESKTQTSEKSEKKSNAKAEKSKDEQKGKAPRA